MNRTSLAMPSFATSALVLLLAAASVPAVAGGRCKEIRADLDEIQSTTGCNAGLASCFLGEVEGSHGFRGVTHFAADSAVSTSPATSPNFLIYSGPFEYRTRRGTIIARETGVTTRGPEGVVTAYQEIVSGTGEYAGATGHFFVSGHKTGGTVDTFVNGEICTVR
ncbi:MULTISPECIES: hypothetical protein [unclassified Lysobacter]|uniref:hypothetical protein n=1 Tax=unclassified Lysobacter TaxID=2635362 RepID=UPI001C247B38|nr:hypothetical protein [Lysobacter sp. MMG2]MBU8975396.1 hypothetical protein [Lysobacter sp. MMG2]